MKTFHVLALVPLAVVAGCASGPRLPPDYMGRILTQNPPDVMASCIGRAASVTPAQSAQGFVVDASPTAQPARLYEVAQDRVQTVVTIRGSYAPGGNALDTAAVTCAWPPLADRP